MNEKDLNLFKKYWPIAIAILFAIAIALGLIQRDDNQYTENNQSSEIKLSESAQDELWGFYNKARDLAPDKKEQKSTATFLAVGDIMLSRNVAQKIKAANDPLLPFRMLDDLFESVDFSFGNLESPISEKSPIIGGHSLIFGAPIENIKGLVDNNFKILSLANNHALDKGIEGVGTTLIKLEQNNIQPFGLVVCEYDNPNCNPWYPAIQEVNGIKICFLGASYASINDNGKTTNNYVARIEDLDRLKSNISYLVSVCDFIVASMHAGTEYTTKPNQAQTDFARAAIDFGADMVIGHHPHWVQTIERYCPASGNHPPLTPPIEGGESADSLPLVGRAREGVRCTNPKYIFYSLGNFIFDQMWSQETREGLTLKIQISKNKDSNLQGPRTPAALDSIELIPVIIDNYSTPRLADEKETKKILEKIGEKETILLP